MAFLANSTVISAFFPDLQAKMNALTYQIQHGKIYKIANFQTSAKTVFDFVVQVGMQQV